MNAEGWYIDPFGRHEARWISDGAPTALVRDGALESQDQPPGDATISGLQRVPEVVEVDGEDLKRADDAEHEMFDPAAGPQAARDAIDQIGTGVYWHLKPSRRPGD